MCLSCIDSSCSSTPLSHAPQLIGNGIQLPTLYQCHRIAFVKDCDPGSLFSLGSTAAVPFPRLLSYATDISGYILRHLKLEGLQSDLLLDSGESALPFVRAVSLRGYDANILSMGDRISSAFGRRKCILSYWCPVRPLCAIQ